MVALVIGDGCGRLWSCSKGRYFALELVFYRSGCKNKKGLL